MVSNENKGLGVDPRMDEHSLAVELDGPDVHPHTVSTVRILELASSWFSLIEVARERNGLSFSIDGIEVLDKCAAVRARTDDPEEAAEGVQAAIRLVYGDETNTRGFGDAIKRAKKALQDLPQDNVVYLWAGRAQRLKVSLPDENHLGPPYSMETMRATPIRAGGARAAVRFEASTEPRAFTLQTSKELARKLGAMLYFEVEISASILRRKDGTIEDGELLEFDKLDETPARPAWEAWYSQHASRLDGVEDIERELGRGED